MSIRSIVGETRTGRWRRATLVRGCATAIAVVPTAATATDAGTHIDNVATLSFTVGGAERHTLSNTASIVVAERLDVTLARSGTGPVARDPKANVAATLTNTGSGHEAFAVSVAPGGTAQSATVVAIDGDGDGRYDPTHDTLLANGQTPVLAPGASIALVIVTDTSAPSTGTIAIAAKALTASGTPGTVAAGQGDGGGDAVIGPTGAAASLTVAVMDATAVPTFVKSQAIKAPDGSDEPISGAVVTYTLDATFGSATDGVRIADPIPAGTRYLPGSLTLDGTALSDAADADAGRADTAGIAVSLGTIPAAATHRVQFQVQIQ